MKEVQIKVISLTSVTHSKADLVFVCLFVWLSFSRLINMHAAI